MQQVFMYARSPVLPFDSFLGEGSPNKIDYRQKRGTLTRTSLLEDLVCFRQVACSTPEPPNPDVLPGQNAGSKWSRGLSAVKCPFKCARFAFSHCV